MNLSTYIAWAMSLVKRLRGSNVTLGTLNQAMQEAAQFLAGATMQDGRYVAGGVAALKARLLSAADAALKRPGAGLWTNAAWAEVTRELRGPDLLQTMFGWRDSKGRTWSTLFTENYRIGLTMRMTGGYKTAGTRYYDPKPLVAAAMAFVNEYLSDEFSGLREDVENARAVGYERRAALQVAVDVEQNELAQDTSAAVTDVSSAVQIVSGVVGNYVVDRLDAIDAVVRPDVVDEGRAAADEALQVADAALAQIADAGDAVVARLESLSNELKASIPSGDVVYLAGEDGEPEEKSVEGGVLIGAGLIGALLLMGGK